MRTSRRVLLIALASFASLHTVFGAAIWNKTNAVGFWRFGTNWSSSPNAPSLASGGTYVTNLSTKTVIVDPATPLTNLIINSLNVWAPTNATNTLLLQDLGAIPLVVSNNNLDVRMRGAIVVSNSSLVVTGNFIQFNLWAGKLTLESGWLITHEPELLTNSINPMRVGRTNAAEFRINGGIAEVGTLQVGEAGLPNARSHGTIRQAGGELRVLGELSIGNSVNCTGVVHLTGGILNVPVGNTNVARIGDDGVGLMTLSNATVTLNNLSVGRHTNALGTLVIENGGLLNALDDVSIGRFGGATGKVFMAGGELRCTDQTLWVGREARGELIVSNGLIHAGRFNIAGLATNDAYGNALIAGGTVLISSNMTIGAKMYTTGEVVIASGNVTVTNADRAAFLNSESGALTMNGGTMAVDNLLLTNSTGRLVLNAGTLYSAVSTVANGMPFVVGNGIAPATFVLGPGPHTFSNGLILSSNATLTGCSNIVGTVINNGGTIAVTNCNISSTPPQFTQQPMSLSVTQSSAATFNALASGTPAPNYQWRFTSPDGSETDVPGATSAVLTIPNAQPANAGDYRVIASNSSGSITSTVATLRVLVRPTIGNLTYLRTNATVSFESVSGLLYVLEYKSQIDGPTWFPLTSTHGTGGLVTLHDPAPKLPSRFYRVRVE